MKPLVFEHFSSNDHNGFLENCSIREELYWRRVLKYCRRALKTVTPYGLDTIDRLLYLGKLHRQLHTSDIFYWQCLLFMLLGLIFCSFIYL